jgi:hypothetical protein
MKRSNLGLSGDITFDGVPSAGRCLGTVSVRGVTAISGNSVAACCSPNACVPARVRLGKLDEGDTEISAGGGVLLCERLGNSIALPVDGACSTVFAELAVGLRVSAGNDKLAVLDRAAEVEACCGAVVAPVVNNSSLSF